MEEIIGIYKIKNEINGKVYIGLSTKVRHRIRYHTARLKQNTHKNKHLQSAFNKHGEHNFSFEVIEECSEDELTDKEKLWIKEFKSHDRKFGYNKTYGGEFGRLSDEIYAEYSKRLKGCVVSEEQKKQISKTLTGRKRPKDEVDRTAISNRRFNDEIELQIICLLNFGFKHREVAQMYNAKLTTIQSIRSRHRKKENKMKKTKLKVALMGTCAGSKWRDEMIPNLEIDYFNPVVEDWTPEDQLEELRQRISCDFVLYTITPKMMGTYSIAEVVDDSNKRPEKTIFLLLAGDDGESFTMGQWKSLLAVKDLVAENGAFTSFSMLDVENYLNSK